MAQELPRGAREEPPVIAAHPIWTPDSAARVARAFRTLGLLGFWIQFVFLARAANILAFLGLVLPLFTTFWCWRYTRLGRALPQAPTPPSGLSRSAWIGVWAGTAGTVVSVLSLFGAAFALVLVMLARPQVGVLISPASEGASAYTVSAVDALSILSLLLMLAAELIVVAFSLRLVFVIAFASRDSGSRPSQRPGRWPRAPRQ
jgi:hypothetical protein